MSGIVWLVIGYALGTIVSGAFYLLTIDKFYIGNLREDKSIPEEPYYFMEISGGRADRLGKNQFALLRIVRENYIRKEEQP